MLQHQLTGFQFGEIEDVIDDRQQVICRTLDGLQVIGLAWTEPSFEHLAGKANHAIEWGAQFVRHVGQEFRFNPRRFLRPFFGQIQLHVLDLHLLKGFAQIRSGLIDTLLHLLVIGRQGDGHRVNPIFQHIQLAQHLAFHAAIELATANLIHRMHHVGNWHGDYTHQAIGEHAGDNQAEHQHAQGRTNFLVLLQLHRPDIKLDCNVTKWPGFVRIVGRGIR